MPDTLRTIIAKIFTSRDELSIGNLRGGLWAAFLVFPLSFIICDMRAFGPETTAFGLESFELMNFTLGFGWFVLFFLPKRSIIPALRVSAVMCAVILPFQMLLPEGLPLLAMFMAFEFFIGKQILIPARANDNRTLRRFHTVDKLAPALNKFVN